MLKAKYFPSIPFSEASVTHNMSYLWRSLLKGKDIVHEGSIWRIGDGRSINVWKDKWVNSLPSHCPSFDGMQQPTSMKVDLLLVDGERAWNEQVLRELFQPEIVSHILKIPLGKTAESDKLIWCDSQLG